MIQGKRFSGALFYHVIDLVLFVQIHCLIGGIYDFKALHKVIGKAIGGAPVCIIGAYFRKIHAFCIGISRDFGIHETVQLPCIHISGRRQIHLPIDLHLCTDIGNFQLYGIAVLRMNCSGGCKSGNRLLICFSFYRKCRSNCPVFVIGNFENQRVIRNTHILAELFFCRKLAAKPAAAIPEDNTLPLLNGNICISIHICNIQLFIAIIEFIEIIQGNWFFVGAGDFQKFHQVRGCIIQMDALISFGFPGVVFLASVHIILIDFCEPDPFFVEKILRRRAFCSKGFLLSGKSSQQQGCRQ